MLAIAAGAAVAAGAKMHSLATRLQARHRLSGNAQAPRSAHLPGLLSSQRFAATDLCLSMRCVQSVRGPTAIRKALPSFTASDGGGLSSASFTSPRWLISGQ